MKKLILVLAKIALGGLFLYNIGLFNVRLPKDDGFVPNQANQQELTYFMREMLASATAKGPAYSPDEYFNDLIAIDEKVKSLTNTYKENVYVNQLFALSIQNFKSGHYTDKQMQVAANRYKKYQDPGRESKKVLQDEIASQGFWVVLKNFLFFKLIPWLWHFYLRNLLLGLALIWIWWYQEYKTWRVKNPISFIISIIAYPYFIGRVFYQRMRRNVRYFSFEVELRKTKTKFFTLLSSNEISDLRHFADSKLPTKEWKRYLAGRGLIARRSLAQALLATVLFSFVSILFSGFALGSEKLSSESNVTIEQAGQGPPGLSHETPNLAHQDSPTFYLSNCDWLESIQLTISQDKSWQTYERRLLYRFQFYQKIKHIPLSINYIQFFSVFVINLKEYKNESKIFIINRFFLLNGFVCLCPNSPEY